MAKLLKKRIPKPMSLEGHPATWSISLVHFNQQQLTEKPVATLNECALSLKSEGITWVHIVGIHRPNEMVKFGNYFDLCPAMMEDVLMSGGRSKLENYKENLFIVMRLLKFNEPTQEAEDEQICLIVGKNYVISCTETDTELFNPILECFRHSFNLIRQRGADYLAYAIIDAVVDNYFAILERVDDQLDILEEELVNHPSPHTLYKIQTAKRQMVLLRRSIWPTREVVSRFLRVECEIITPQTKIFMQNVYDHIIQAIETIESFRDIVGGLLDIYLSNMSQRLNEIMKVLTVVATIFYPLSFITGIYGMNFDYMPELHSRWAYPSVLAAMVIAAGSMLYFFRRKQWI